MTEQQKLLALQVTLNVCDMDGILPVGMSDSIHALIEQELKTFTRTLTYGEFLVEQKQALEILAKNHELFID